MLHNAIINGETAIKPYYYMRNGLLHIRYIVDRAVELSESEVKATKDKITLAPYNKQEILSKLWNLLTVYVERPVLLDGIKAGEDKMKELTQKARENG